MTYHISKYFEHHNINEAISKKINIYKSVIERIGCCDTDDDRVLEIDKNICNQLQLLIDHLRKEALIKKNVELENYHLDAFCKLRDECDILRSVQVNSICSTCYSNVVNTCICLLYTSPSPRDS